MKYYVKINHPYRIGEELVAVPTGKKRTENGAGTEICVRVITPKTGMDTLWIKKEDLVIN